MYPATSPRSAPSPISVSPSNPIHFLHHLVERISAAIAQIWAIICCKSETLDDTPVSPLTLPPPSAHEIGTTPPSPLSPRTPSPILISSLPPQPTPVEKETPEEDLFALAQNADPGLQKRLIFSGLLCPSVFLPFLPPTSFWKSLKVECANYKSQDVIGCTIELNQTVEKSFCISKRDITYKMDPKISWLFIPKTGQFILENTMECSLGKHTLYDRIWTWKLDPTIQQSQAFKEWKKGNSEMNIKFSAVNFFCQGGILELNYSFQLECAGQTFSLTPVPYSGPLKDVLKFS